MLRMRAIVIVLSVTSSAMAASNRVFVSGSGVDVGTCPITSPCRSFAYAYTRVSAGGEIIALNTAGYGAVTINQSVIIVAAPGATAFVSASSGTAITVSPAQTDTVTLRGLALSSTGGSDGIYFTAGLLNVENCIINGFANAGINFIASGVTTNPRLQVINSVIRNNNWGIIAMHFGTGTDGEGLPPGAAFVTIANSTFTGNGAPGLDARDNVRGAVSDSLFAGNLHGVAVASGSDHAVAIVSLDRCTLSRNLFGVSAGVGFQNPRGIVHIANCTVTMNSTGLNVAGPDGQILSQMSNSVFTNTVVGNIFSDGSPTGTYTAK